MTLPPAYDDLHVGTALFDPDMATSTSHGTGIGLFVMKWCSESLGGEIRFERSDRGNEVYFYLPSETPPEER